MKLIWHCGTPGKNGTVNYLYISSKVGPQDYNLEEKKLHYICQINISVVFFFNKEFTKIHYKIIAIFRYNKEWKKYFSCNELKKPIIDIYYKKFFEENKINLQRSDQEIAQLVKQ